MFTNNSCHFALRWILCAFFSCSIFVLSAQLQDDFSDGDFTNNPAWLGNTALFSVNLNSELQLLDPAPGSSNTSFLYLPAPTSTSAATTWEFYFLLDFAPSSSNYGLVYLGAATSDLTADQDGYYVKLGGVSGDTDALELYRESNGSSTLLISGTAGALGLAPAQARVRITRSTVGEWALYADYSGGTNFQLEGQAVDATFSTSANFGFVCNYTSTRNEHFFFDDLLIDPIYQDLDPPQLLEVVAESATQLRVTFNEALDPLSAEAPDNYTIDAGIGMPVTAQLDVGIPTELTLTLGNPLQNGASYSLTVSGVEDLAQNAISSASLDFDYQELSMPLPFEVLMHEIMADPTPSIGLPDAEFIEIYNPSAKTFQLEGWSISSGSTPAVLPDYLFAPGTYLILCDEDDAADLAPYGSVLGLSNFPALVNSGDQLVLLGADLSIIHVVAYTDEWYRSSAKKDGGWTLEMINPEAPCADAENWIASESLSGGTPGAPNSVHSETPDTFGPRLLQVYPEDAYELFVQFDEFLDTDFASDPANYIIDPPISIGAANIDPFLHDRVNLLLDEPLDSFTVYTLSLSNGLTDCIGNPATGLSEVRFGLPAIPGKGDLLINELLFHPEVGGSDFVELFHAGDRPIDLNDLVIGNIQEASDSLVGLSVSRLIFPGDYVVLTESPADILERYEVPDPGLLVQTDLPTFGTPSGNVTIVSPGIEGAAVILDVFDYTEEMHHPLLDETRGVSLERLRLSDSTNVSSNWHSAAATAGFATPTAPNSNLFEDRSGNLFRLAYPSFSPNGDGFRDVLLLDYDLEEPDFVANIRVFDTQGRQIRVLAANALLAGSGSFQWAGDTENGDLASMGIYVIWIEYFHPDGRKFEQKISCVLAKDFR
ncbi:MAG: lamin tail domain-containing protein [Saprospiraceae bacterium]|nr:lamin tail domain-containing protein [Saprospiraceae bacterium]